MDSFELEKKALRYCEKYGISEDDPRRGDVINAFCVGAKIEREACVQIVDVKQGVEAWEIHGGQETLDVLRDLAATIRARSNAKGQK